MGDTDGSSEAAQSARLADEFDSMEIVEEDTPKSGGFFSRVMGALSASAVSYTHLTLPTTPYV